MNILYSPPQSTNLTTIVLSVLAGTRYEPESKRGLAHLLEHSLFLGSKKYPNSESINQLIDRTGSYSQAETNSDTIKIYFQFGSEHKNEFLDLLEDILVNPILDENKIENEKAVIGQEIQRFNNNHFSKVFHALASDAYPIHPYSRHPLGTIESLKGITIGDLAKYHSSRFVKENMNIAVVSKENDFNFGSQNIFSANQLEKTQDNDSFIQEFSLPTSNYTEIDISSVQDYLVLSYFFPKLTPKKDQVRALIYNYLGYKRTSLLYREIRLKQGLAYNVSANGFKSLDLSGFYIATSTTETEKTLKVIKNCIYTLKSQLTNQSVEILKNQQLNVFNRNYVNPFYDTNQLVDTKLYLGKAITKEMLFEYINSISIEDIIDFIEEYLTDEHLVVGVGKAVNTLKNLE